MKLEIRSDSVNYACTVVRLPPKQVVPGLDKLVKVTVFGNDVLTQKDSDESQLYLFFPAECCISKDYLSANDEYRNTELNNNKLKKGYFEDTGRVKSIKFKGIISTGYITPITTLDELDCVYSEGLKEGDEFTDINGVNICKKYKIIRQQGLNGGKSKASKKLEKFDKLVPNQFRFHQDTSQLAKNLHLFNPTDIIVITAKWHGTSAIFSNVLIKKELTWKERLAKFFGVHVVETTYDHLYASRTVIKNQYINKDATPGYYNEDIWKTVQDEVKDKIEQGITLYGEIVGYLLSSKEIQKGYDYGCSPSQADSKRSYDTIWSSMSKLEKMQYLKDNNLFCDDDWRFVPPVSTLVSHHNCSLTDFDKLKEKQAPQHKFVVYRITYTKPDGNVIEFSWQQIKDYCKKYQLEHVKELYFGRMFESSLLIGDTIKDTTYEHPEWRDEAIRVLSETYLEKDCKWCLNKVPAEGIVVRRDGLETYSAYKLKSKRFLERESKQLDEDVKNGQINIEDEQPI